VAVIEPAIAELEQRLRRYPPDRYPVQHATAQFHLGVALANAGRIEAAETALRAALRIFEPERLPVERAKVLNALGAVLRLAGRMDAAAAAFEDAAVAFGAATQPLEEGAAFFNLGLVRRDLGDHPAAEAAFDHARRLLDERRVPTQAGAAARELGVTLLERGSLERAVEQLEEAARLAAEQGDRAGLGAALNALGLARLARGDTLGAVESFRDAAAAHPYGVRPQEHAMVKTNLALAHERDGDLPRARLAAAQAVAVPEAPQAVKEQARAILERIGAPAGDLLTILDDEPDELRIALVREELLRLLASAPEERDAELARWVEQTAARGPDFAETWLAALLELPTQELEALVGGVVAAVGRLEPRAAERVRADLAAATARFHLPQLIRLKDTFDRVAIELGQQPWS
jgi:tetratricopeptide (TPR) repeat protein